MHKKNKYSVDFPWTFNIISSLFGNKTIYKVVKYIYIPPNENYEDNINKTKDKKTHTKKKHT